MSYGDSLSPRHENMKMTMIGIIDKTQVYFFFLLFADL